MVNINKQQGVVLVAAMVMILMVSGIAVTVMSASAVDSKMVNATQDAYRAESIARGDTERAIKFEVENGAANRFLTKKDFNDASSMEMTLSTAGSTVVMTNENASNVVQLLPCSPKFAPTPDVRCNYMQIRTTKSYGKGDKHTLTLNTGIEQEMIGSK